MRHLLAIIFLWTSPAWALDGLARVVDGDTIVVARERVRLRNFDAPELSDPGGPEASQTLAAIIAGRQVHCDPVARDRYGRTVALCQVDGLDLGKAMRAAGVRQKRRLPETP